MKQVYEVFTNESAATRAYNCMKFAGEKVELSYSEKTGKWFLYLL